MDLYTEISNLESYDAFRNVLNNITLDDKQCVHTLLMLYLEQACLCYDTGMGKTLLASAWMRLLKNEAKGRKFLMFIKNSQLIQTPQKVKNVSGLECYATSAQLSDYNKIFKSKKFLECDVLMLTHNTLNDVKFMYSLLCHRDEFIGVIVDEMHLVCNYTNSQSSFMLKSILSLYKYRLGLTATPITVSEDQLAKIMTMLLPNVEDYKKLVTQFNKKIVPFDIAKHIIVRERDYNNNDVHVVLVEPTLEQVESKEPIFSRSTKGSSAEKSMVALLKTINSYKKKGKRGLVYVNLSEIYDFVDSIMKQTPFKYAFVNGRVTGQDRIDIVNAFNRGEYDILFTNAKEALDLDCDYVCFYELTVHVRQMVGRALRGLDPRPIDVVFILVKGTKEIPFFLNNIYSVAMKVKSLIGQNCKELEDAFKSIKEE